MFYGTFYYPYVKYMLEDIKVFCLLLSSADKNQRNNNPDVTYNKKKAFSIKALCRWF